MKSVKYTFQNSYWKLTNVNRQHTFVLYSADATGMDRPFTLCQYILDTHLSKIADVFSMVCISSSGSCSLLFNLSPLCFRPSDLSVKHYNKYSVLQYAPNFRDSHTYIKKAMSQKNTRNINLSNLTCVVLSATWWLQKPGIPHLAEVRHQSRMLNFIHSPNIPTLLVLNTSV